MTTERVNQLEEDLKAVRDDIKALTHGFKEYAAEQKETLENYAESKAEQVKASTKAKIAQGSEYYDQAKEQLGQSVQEKPLQTVAVAAGVGLLVGLLLRGRR